MPLQTVELTQDCSCVAGAPWDQVAATSLASRQQASAHATRCLYYQWSSGRHSREVWCIAEDGDYPYVWCDGSPLVAGEVMIGQTT